MNKCMNKSKSSQLTISGPLHAAPASVSRPIHEMSHPRPIATHTPTHEDIARRAYQIYVDKGFPQGQSDQIWKQAEQEQLNRGLSAFLSR